GPSAIVPCGFRELPTPDMVGAVSSTCLACVSSSDGPEMGADSPPAGGAGAAGALLSGVGWGAVDGAEVCTTSVPAGLDGFTAAASGTPPPTGAVGVAAPGPAPAARNFRS